MNIKSDKQSVALKISAIVSITLVILSAIGAWVYVEHQRLNQDRVTKEKQIEAEKEAARLECRGNAASSGNASFLCN